jgi:hypothetical protein
MGFIPFERFKGLNNLLSVTNKGLRWLEQGDNIDITNQGGWQMRKGFRQRVSVDGHSIWSDGEILLYRTGTNLVRLFPNMSTLILRTDLNINELPMSYLSLLGKIYYSDGKDKGVIMNGVYNRTWGVTEPRQPLCTTITGTLSKGIYKVITTYIRSDGQESGASVPTAIELTDDVHAIRVITEASSDPTIAAISVYVTTPNGTAFRFYTRTTNAINMIDIVDVTSVAALTYPLETQHLSTLPPGVLLTTYKSRVLVAENYNIWCSLPFSYELCNRSEDYISFAKPVRMLCAVDDGLWVGTEQETYFLVGDNPPYKIDKTIPYGVIEGQWATDVPGEKLLRDDIKGKVAIWGSSKGICVGGANGFFLNLTENTYNFPIASIGHGIVRENNEMNQFLMLVKEPLDNPNVERPFKNEAHLILPGFTINAHT